jgi:hypothetical protein
MLSSDYPRHTRHSNEELLAALSIDQAERIPWSNAAEWYRL